MDSVGIGGFDVEAQESFLGRGSAEAETSVTNANARKAFSKIVLLVRSTELFRLAAANAGSSSTITAADYSVIGSPDQEHVLIQGAEDAAVAEIPLEIFRVPSAADESEQNNLLQSFNINEIVRAKDLEDLNRYGGVRGIAEALNTDLENGMSVVRSERAINESKNGQICQGLASFFHPFFVACNNYTVLLLSITGVLILSFGINEKGLENGWIDGTVILLIVVALVVVPTLLNHWRKRVSWKLWNCWGLNLKGRIKEVRVIRGGGPYFVPEACLRAGDIAVLNKGDQVPGDGIFIPMAGQLLELDNGGEMKSTIIDESNPFILYPSRVINGNGKMVVTAVGMETAFGEKMGRGVESPDNNCIFEAYLHKVNVCIQVTGLIISILIIVVLFLRFKAGKLDDENESYNPDPKEEPVRVQAMLEAMKGIITGSKGTARVLTALLGVSLLGIMDGMPFVISIAIVIKNHSELAHKASVSNYLACLKMAPVTTICSDKFGGLTEHDFVVDKLFVGGEIVSESSVIASEILEGLCDGLQTLLLISPDGGCGPKLDQVISWAKARLGMKEGSLREQWIECEECCNPLQQCCCNPLQQCCRNPFQQCCQVFVDKGENEGKYCIYTGPAQHILSLCSRYYEIEGGDRELDGRKRRMFDQAIELMLAEGAEMVACARERLNGCGEWPVRTNGITFLGMIGLEDTKRMDTKTSISTLTKGGVRTIIASGEDVEVLKTIGKNGGILDPDESTESRGLVLTGEDFRKFSDEEKMDNVEKICIMGNCQPSDKILLIKCLQEKGQVVALVAQQTIDAPALLQADIGIAFGTWSSDVARERCDICIWDHGLFGVVANAIETGRCFQQNVRKFIQLLLILTISSSSINFFSIVVLGDAPITAIELLCLNLVVAFVGGLALLTAPRTNEQMTESAQKPSRKLITKSMWRNIAIQASYQISIFVALQQKGHVILGISNDRVKSMIYNGFFICQTFNKIIAREPERKNIFSGLQKKWQQLWFSVALLLMLACQAAVTAVEKAIRCSSGLSSKQWAACLLIGFVSLLLDCAGKFVLKFDHRGF